MIKPKFVTGLPISMVPGGLNEPRRPSFEESAERVAQATVRRQYGTYRGPKRNALEQTGIRRIGLRMVGERED